MCTCAMAQHWIVIASVVTLTLLLAMKMAWVEPHKFRFYAVTAVVFPTVTNLQPDSELEGVIEDPSALVVFDKSGAKRLMVAKESIDGALRFQAGSKVGPRSLLKSPRLRLSEDSDGSNAANLPFVTTKRELAGSGRECKGIQCSGFIPESWPINVEHTLSPVWRPVLSPRVEPQGGTTPPAESESSESSKPYDHASDCKGVQCSGHIPESWPENIGHTPSPVWRPVLRPSPYRDQGKSAIRRVPSSKSLRSNPESTDASLPGPHRALAAGLYIFGHGRVSNLVPSTVIKTQFPTLCRTLDQESCDKVPQCCWKEIPGQLAAKGYCYAWHCKLHHSKSTCATNPNCNWVPVGRDSDKYHCASD